MIRSRDKTGTPQKGAIFVTIPQVVVPYFSTVLYNNTNTSKNGNNGSDNNNGSNDSKKKLVIMIVRIIMVILIVIIMVIITVIITPNNGKNQSRYGMGNSHLRTSPSSNRRRRLSFSMVLG